MRFLFVVTEPDTAALDTYTEVLKRAGVLLTEPRAWLIEARTEADAEAWARRSGEVTVEVHQIS